MSNFEAHCYSGKGRYAEIIELCRGKWTGEDAKNSSRRRDEGCVIGGASSARSSVLLPWQVSSLLVSDPRKILKDVPPNGFFSV